MVKLLKQAIRFLGLSGIGWLLDMATYTILGFFWNRVDIINIISSWVGVTFVFSQSTKFVFQNNSKIPLKIKYLIYLSYQAVLIFAISYLLAWANGFLLAALAGSWLATFSAIIAKVLVTPITMTVNFFVMKGIIEKL